ncbi:fatty acyl-CoA hydrolase precursor, medium chain-like [Pelodytes ibericus]
MEVLLQKLVNWILCLSLKDKTFSVSEVYFNHLTAETLSSPGYSLLHSHNGDPGANNTFLQPDPRGFGNSKSMLFTGQGNTQPVANTKYGKLLGKTVTVKGTDRPVHTFLGVPFAKPPVGKLRFAPPQPPAPWSSIRDATKDAPMCIQSKKLMEATMELSRVDLKLPPISEDCLYLNLFTTGDRDKNSKLPVMVYIHGGGLSTGSATMYNGASLSAFEDVVVVAVQYRLGILGFFNSSNEGASGNCGFLDQVQALRWVQENIEDFGGDPRSVTIFGQSAGGLSVSALVLSPLAKGLFHRAISESGVALMPGMIISKPEEFLFVRNSIANKSGCAPDSLVACLKDKTEEDMISITNSLGILSIPACVDGVFLPKPVEEMLANKENKNVPFMIGINEQEFGWFLPSILDFDVLKEGMDKETVKSVLKSFPFMKFTEELLPLVMVEYFGGTNDPLEIRNRILDLLGDLMFVIPALRIARHHRDSGFPVFFYNFVHQSSMFKDSRPDFVKADHGDELQFVFGGPFLKDDVLFRGHPTEKEKTLSKTFMKYWANFARTGDPNGQGLEKWPKYTNTNEGYLEINLEPKSLKKLKEGRFDFWTKTIKTNLRLV